MLTSDRRSRAKEREAARIVQVFLKFFSIELLAGLLILLVAQLWALLRAGEVGSLGWRVALRAATRNFRGPDEIAIVKIDERTARRWRSREDMPRDFLAKLIAKIEEAEPRAVGIDVFLDRAGEDPAADASLRQTIGWYSNIVLVSEIERSPSVAGLYREYRPDDAYFPSDLDSGSMPAVGHSMLAKRGETCYGYLPVVPTPEYGLCPCFGVATYLVALGVRSDGQVRSKLARLLGGERDSISVALGPVIRRGVSGEPLPVNFLGRPGRTFRRVYPASAILNMDLEALRAALHDRIVLVGATYRHARDKFRTPVSGAGLADGIEIHANIVASYLLREHIVPSSSLVRLVLYVASVLLTIVLFQRTSFLRAILLLFLGIAAYWVLAFAAFLVGSPQWLPLVKPTLFSTSTALFMIFYKSLRVELARDEIERLWGPRIGHSYLLELEETTATPDRLVSAGAGQKETVTVACLAVHGLSELAESGSLPEQQAIRLVDEFIDTIQEQVVFAKHRRGAADRFFGYKMLVFCGVPVAKDDREEAEMAAGIALDSLHHFGALREEWKKRFGPEMDRLWLGIGIHTGPVVVGSIHNRIGEKEYTIVGRTPHLAEQIEGLVEEVEAPSPVLVSGATASLIGASFELQRIGIDVNACTWARGTQGLDAIFALTEQKA